MVERGEGGREDEQEEGGELEPGTPVALRPEQRLSNEVTIARSPCEPLASALIGSED